MQDSLSIKQAVKEKYSQIALENADGCCGDSSCCGDEVSFIGEDYKKLDGYNSDADLGLGCGLPTEYARLQEGQTVLDLGSGAGNDCFIARSVVGETGKVLGVDMAEPMIDLARKNASKMGYSNMEFRLGEIEDLPFADNLADVVVSNCVLNLVPNKQKAFSETFRVLKPGGHFSISDVVIQGKLPEGLQEQAELYVGCVAGAMDKDEYLQIVRNTGFENIEIQKLRPIQLPENLLEKFGLSQEQISQTKDLGIYSLSLFAQKPKAEDCCEPGCCG